MKNEEEGFEEWDAEFLDQLIQVEELALSSTAPIPNTSSSSFPLQPLPQQQPLHLVAAPKYHPLNYSPPRELSQRTSDFGSFFPPSSNGFPKPAPSAPLVQLRGEIDKELEIQRLKRELGHVSRQLLDLEQEGVELRKETEKKNEQLKDVFLKNDENFADDQGLKSTNLCKVVNNGEDLGREGLLALDYVPHQEFQKKVSSNDKTGSRINIATSTFKAIGVQTDKTSESPQSPLHEALPACHNLSKKLITIWASPNDQMFGQSLISNLLSSCQTEFGVLFGFMGKLPASAISSQYNLNSVHGAEAVKVSDLYSMLTKISNGLAPMEGLIGPLLDLCSLENGVIVHRSLHVLHAYLKHLLFMERKSERRKNVMVEELHTGQKFSHGSEEENIRGLQDVSTNKLFDTGYNPFGIRFPEPKDKQLNHVTSLFPRLDWVALFELMHQIVMRYNEECVRLEAVSIMNMILMRSNTYTEREKFDQNLLFESVLQLLKREAGLRVQKLAVHLLFLILNCPKLLAEIFSGCKEGEAGNAEVNVRYVSTFKKFFVVLHHLADCIAGSGNGIQEIKLRRNAIILLAFLASSGRPGFEVLVSHKVSRDSSFLMLILQLVVSEVDREVADSSEPPVIFRERTLLLRESLILLNRLVSQPAYSSTTLRVLTSSRDMANLTIDIANRLSLKRRISGCYYDIMSRKMRESEIVDLARVFQKRVFTYLGDMA